MEKYLVSVNISRADDGIKCSSDLDEQFLLLPITKKLGLIKLASTFLSAHTPSGGDKKTGVFDGSVTVEITIVDKKAGAIVCFSESLQDLHPQVLALLTRCASQYLLKVGVALLSAHKKKAS
jgi:hypothetical protein